MKLFERGFGANIDNVPLYNNQRWIKHTFDITTQYNRQATYRGNQDLSAGINLFTRHFIKFAVDGGTPVEVDLQGVVPTATTSLEITTKINNAAGFKLTSMVVLDSLLEFKSSTSGPTSRITFYPTSSPSTDASAIVLGLDPLDLPLSFPTFPYAFQLADSYIVSIPTLQNKVHDELASILLTESTDYEVEFGTGIISFAAPPSSSLWAKDNLVNKETPYNNFGYLLDIYDSNKSGYLKAIKGLWFAFWTGPRPENIRKSLYLLFGLPVASQAGVVTDVTTTSITLRYNDNSTETFQIPSELYSLVAIDNNVTKFQPLVTGITVMDKVNNPGFLEREVGRFGIQSFLTEKATRGTSPDSDESRALKTIEQNTYLPQIDVNAFISPDIKLSNVKSFLRNIQPKSRTFLFQVLVGTFRDLLDVEEVLSQHISLDVSPNVDSNPNTFAQQSDLDDAESNNSTGIILDGEGVGLADHVDIDVYHGLTFIESFSLSG